MRGIIQVPQGIPVSFVGSPQKERITSGAPSERIVAGRFTGQVPAQTSTGQQQGPPFVTQLEESLAKALDEVACAKEEIGKEMKDRLAAYHEFRENLTKEQERVGRLSSTLENAMVEMRTSCQDMRRRNESLREEVKMLKAAMVDSLKQTQEEREQKFSSIGSTLMKIDDATATEAQESEVQAAVLRNDLITTLAARVQNEADARSEMTSLAGDVNSALQAEAKERMRRDAALEAAIDETRAGLGQMSTKIEEISRSMEKDIAGRLQAQGEYQEEFEKQQERLQRLKLELQKAASQASVAPTAMNSRNSSALSPRSPNPPVVRQYSAPYAGQYSPQGAVSAAVVRYATTASPLAVVPPANKKVVDPFGPSSVVQGVCQSPRSSATPLTPRGGHRIAVGHTGGAPSTDNLTIQAA